jgi:S-DNA-T family DNA segregation ATPase FtsK/SpoIIIE
VAGPNGRISCRRGASADLISSDPPTGAGAAFIRLETDPDPVRVRAGFVTDPDIRAMCDTYAAPPLALADVGEAA